VIQIVEGKLFHSLNGFERQAFEKRMSEYGFKNINRIELFLWDLELFQQIQNILKDRVVLKGGAAVQFYLPIRAQRTSVDIDMIFNGTKVEIEQVLGEITDKLGGENNLFVFEQHAPKKPKTQLPLYTYFVKVPSALTEKELQKESAIQEIKIEFFTETNGVEIAKMYGSDLFAISSEYEYNILPLDNLFGDKLTTLGPNTIGIQDDRMDEQVKQLYDIWMLIIYHFKELNLEIIRKKYFRRAEVECTSRGIPFNLPGIKVDIFRQLRRMSEVDGGKDAELKKYINDFKGLYLNANINFSPSDVACAAEQIKLVYEMIFNDFKDLHIVKKAFEIADNLQLSQFQGVEKGEKVKELRDILIREFASYSTLDIRVLKGKKLNRVFWSVADKDNITEIETVVIDYLGL
jgi:hypothetical protein